MKQVIRPRRRCPPRGKRRINGRAGQIPPSERGVAAAGARKNNTNIVTHPASKPKPASPSSAPAPAPDLETILSSLGLQHTRPNFERVGVTAGELRARAQAEPQVLQRQLGDFGLKMGQRQKMINALLID